jgi:hypothetical protein
MNGQASQKIMEPNSAQRELTRLESNEEFEKKLNFSYLSKDLNKHHPHNGTFSSRENTKNFMQTFNPSKTGPVRSV